MNTELEKRLKSFMRELISEKKFNQSSLVKEGFQELVNIRLNLKEMTLRAENAEVRVSELERALAIGIREGSVLDGDGHDIDTEEGDDKFCIDFFISEMGQE